MARKKIEPRVNICRNVDGLLTSNEEEIFDRWVRHFNKLLNGSKCNESVTFTTISSNQILTGKHRTQQIPPLVRKLKQH
jgi:site-specific DNA-cytosine methylase